VKADWLFRQEVMGDPTVTPKEKRATAINFNSLKILVVMGGVATIFIAPTNPYKYMINIDIN
jgi:hypothetical protein